MFVLVLVTAVACLSLVVFVPGNNPGSGPSDPTPDQLVNVCGTDKPVRAQLAESTDSRLKKLAEYEKVCDGSFTDMLMIFSSMPRTTEEAVPMAEGMASTLKEFAKYKVRPLVILEPVAEDGTYLPLGNFRKGLYDAALATYFQSLKDADITDGMMGTWVPFPEANTPVWATTNPDIFAGNVNHVVEIQKQYFPKSKASILLDSRSYPDNDTAWKKGEYRSLLPYVAGIDKKLIDSFGYQGFPWLPPADGGDAAKPNISAKEYLRADLAREAAETMDVKQVWFNTGTINRSHTSNAETEVVMKPQERAEMLDDAMTQVRELRQDGLEVAVHLFAEDKSHKKEGVDWSYWPQGKPESSDATRVFQDFVRRAQLSGTAIWLYDDYQSPTD